MEEKKQMLQRSRIDWVDVAKGIGMILVIIGHCVYLESGIHNWIFSFHMPLFFLLSGLFVKRESVFVTIRKKSKSLLLPYIIFFAVGLAFTLIIPAWRDELTLKGIAADIYMGSPDAVNVSSVWFLLCLFITALILEFCFIMGKAAPFAVILIGCAGFLFAGFRNEIDILPGNRLPFDVDVAMIAILFLSAGYYGKKMVFSFVEKIEKDLTSNIVVGLLSLVISIVISYLNKRVNLHGLLFNNIILYILGAAIGTAFIIALSVLVLRVQRLKSFLLWFGCNSVKVLGAQALLIRIYIFIIDLIEGEPHRLYFLPKHHIAISIIFVIGFSFLAVYLFNKLHVAVKSEIKKRTS